MDNFRTGRCAVFSGLELAGVLVGGVSFGMAAQAGVAPFAAGVSAVGFEAGSSLLVAGAASVLASAVSCSWTLARDFSALAMSLRTRWTSARLIWLSASSGSRLAAFSHCFEASGVRGHCFEASGVRAPIATST